MVKFSYHSSFKMQRLRTIKYVKLDRFLHEFGIHVQYPPKVCSLLVKCINNLQIYVINRCNISFEKKNKICIYLIYLKVTIINIHLVLIIQLTNLFNDVTNPVKH